MAISNDQQADAKRMSEEIGGGIRILSDPSMRVIYRYGMKGEGMPMAVMGYVVVDREGVIRDRAIDREFGQHVDAMMNVLRASARVIRN